MKHLRITAEVCQERAPAFYTTLSDSPAINETHLLEWNTTAQGSDTVLFAVNGDTEPFVDAAPEMTGIKSVRRSTGDQQWTYVLVEMNVQRTPLFDAIREARTRSGLIVRKPIVYSGGDMHFRVVGSSEALQNALDEAPDGIRVQLEEIRTFRGSSENPLSALSDRQYEAVATALDIGYYDYPHRVTHADIADELDCAPQTASEHLQKGEAKLVRTIVNGFRASYL